MKKLISSKFTYYDDFYEGDNMKKYRDQGIYEPYIPNEEWMNELGNEYYMIWAPQTNRRTKLEVVKGKIGRGIYGAPWIISAKYLDKPFKGAGWNKYFPRYCWGDAYEFMSIPLTEDNKLGCLVFDNEQEAREFCDAYNEWKENKNKKRIKDHLNSPEVKKEFKDYLEKVKNLINNIDENDSEHYYGMIKDIYWSDERFRK